MGIWENNVAHSMLIGVYMMPDDGLPICSHIANFTIHNAFDFGIYAQGESSFQISNVNVLDSNLGLYITVVGPPSVTHEFADKYVAIQDSSFVGHSSVSDCSAYPKNFNHEASLNGRSFRTTSGGRVGISWGQFISSPNGMPDKPFSGIISYNTIGGKTTINGKTS